MKRLTFSQALRAYFGARQDRNFGEEIASLSKEDRQFFLDYLPTVGYEIIEYKLVPRKGRN